MRIPVLFGWLLLGAAVPALACSSTPGGGTGGAAGSGSGGAAGSAGTNGSGGSAGRGIMPGSGGTAAPKNPYGIAYPTNNIGTNARAGNVPGNQMQNFAFLGYVNAKPGTPTTSSGPLQTISLANFYDPENQKYKLLRLSASASWCPHCITETQDYVPAAGMLEGKGIVILQTLTEGFTRGTAAVTGDLHTWIEAHGVDYAMVLDPENANLGAFFNEAAVPWSADIDVRTMEIVNAGVGYGGGAVQELEMTLAQIQGRAPSYPCPSGMTLKANHCAQ